MEFRPPAMQPAFHDTRHLIGWVAMLIAILFSPGLTTLAVTPEIRYLVTSIRIGPSDWHANQIFEQTAPLDVLFIGHSGIWTAIDHAELDREMAARGIPTESATIGFTGSGYDFVYTMLTDFFARRRARLVVVNYPDVHLHQTFSNPAEKYVRRISLFDPGLDLGKPALAATNYGEMALVGFRLLLASIIHPRPADMKGYPTSWGFSDHLEATKGSLLREVGFQEEKWRTGLRPPTFVTRILPGDPLGAMIVGAGFPPPAWVNLTDEPLTPIESTYLPAIKALCEKNGAVLALMLPPEATVRDKSKIEISRQALALGIPIMAATLDMLFGDVSDGSVKDHYSDQRHLNKNGARQGAKAFATPLQVLLTQAGGR
jgi:hypothetical protein